MKDIQWEKPVLEVDINESWWPEILLDILKYLM